MLNTYLTYHYTPTKMVKFKMTVSSVVKEVKQLKPSYISRRNVKLHNHFRKQLSGITEN